MHLTLLDSGQLSSSFFLPKLPKLHFNSQVFRYLETKYYSCLFLTHREPKVGNVIHPIHKYTYLQRSKVKSDHKRGSLPTISYCLHIPIGIQSQSLQRSVEGEGSLFNAGDFVAG